MLRVLAFCLALVLSPAAAQAQAVVLQGGPFQQQHIPMYASPGGAGGQAVVMDSGPASGGGVGIGIAEQLLVTPSLNGQYPAAGSGTGIYGANWCDYDAPITNAGGGHYLCMTPNGSGNNAVIAVGAFGSAPQQSLCFEINGNESCLPEHGGFVTYVAPITPNDLACWNAAGVLKDCTSTLPNGLTILDATLGAAASATTGANFNLAPGVAPTSPNNGDVWTTATGAQIRLNGATDTIAVSASGPIVLNVATGNLTCPTCATGTGGALTANLTGTSGFASGQALVSDGSKLQALSYTSANTASTIMERDGSGNVAFGTATGSLTGHASNDLALVGGALTGPLEINQGSFTPSSTFPSTTAPFGINESPTGTCTSGGVSCYYNFLDITSDNSVVGSGTSGMFNNGVGFYDSHAFGGSTATGNRLASAFQLVLSSTTGNTGGSIGASYSALGAYMNAAANDNGTGTTLGTAKGQLQAANFAVTLGASATDFFAGTGLEINTNFLTGSSAYEKVGLQITQLATDAVAASTYNTAIGISNQSGAVGWTNGILFGGLDGSWPFLSTGTAITCAGSCGTLGSFIDMSSATFSNYFLKSATFSVAGSGAVVINKSGTAAQALTVAGTDGSNSSNLEILNSASGAATPAKFIRVDSLGNLQFLNSAANTTIFYLTDAGALSHLTGVASSGPITFSGLSTAGIVTTTSGGLLSSEAAITAAQCPVATTGANGCVKPDGTSITISGGVISSTGSGTVNSGTANQFTFYSATGTAVSGNSHLSDSGSSISSTEPISIVGATGVSHTATGAGTDTFTAFTGTETINITQASTGGGKLIGALASFSVQSIGSSVLLLGSAGNNGFEIDASGFDYFLNQATSGTVASSVCTASNGEIILEAGNNCFGGGSGLAVGTTTISGGTSGDIEFNNAGVLGEKGVTGTGSVVLATSPNVASLTVTSAFSATGLVTNSDLANSSMTIAGHSISLGGTQAIAYSDLSSGAPTATTSVLGLVKPDGTSITISGGVISAVGGGGSGTVNSGSSGQVGYYATSGTAISGESLSALLDASLGSTQGSVLYRGASTWTVLTPGTSGYFLETQGASANPTWAPASGGSGCSTGGSAGNLLTSNGSGGCTTDTNSSLTNGALALGSSGTAGSVAMGNATSGTITLQPTTGALGTVTATIQAATDVIVDRSTTDTLTNKTISGSANTLSNIANASLANSSVTIGSTSVSLGATAATISGLSLVAPVLGVATATSINKVAITAPATSATLTIANGKTLTVSNTLTLAGTDSSTLNIGTGGTLGTAAYQATGTSGGALPFLNGTNAWSGAQTFGEVLGTVTTQSGTTYTFAAADCGTEVTFSSNSAVTATIPATLPAGCNIAAAQLGTAKVSVNGSAVSAATLHSAHSYTGTSGQYAIIGINIEANSGGSAAIALLSGDGS